MAQSVGAVALDIVMGKNTVSGVVSQAMRDVEKSVGSASATVGDKVTAIGNSCSKVGSALMPVSSAVTAVGIGSVKTAADFESAMSQVSAVSGATGSDFVALKEKAQEMGRKTKFSASESAEALNYMAMAGWKTDDMLNGLEGVMNLAAASGADLATTSDIVTDAITAFGLSASDSAHFADVLAAASSNANTNVVMMGETFKYVAPVAGALGYNVEDMSVAIGLMANSGIKGSQAGTSLRSVLTRLAKPTKESANAMSALGLSITDQDGKMKSFNEIMLDMREGFAGLTEDEKAFYAAQLGGQEAMSGLLAIVNSSDEDFNKLSEAINGCDGSAESMANTMNDNLNGRLTLLKSQLEGVAIEIGENLTPIIDKCIDAVSSFADWFSELDDNQKENIITIGLVVAAAAPLLMITGQITSGFGSLLNVGSSVTKMFGGASGAMGGVAGAASGASGATSGLGSALGAITPTVGAVIAVVAALAALFVYMWNTNEDFRQGMTDAWNNIVETCKPIIEDLGNALKDLWDGVLKPLLDFYTSVLAPVIVNFAELFGNIFGGLLRILTGVIEFITGVFTGDWEKAWGGICDIFGGLWDDLCAYFGFFTDTLSDVFGVVSGWCSDIGLSFGSTWETAESDTTSAWEGIKSTCDDGGSSIAATTEKDLGKVESTFSTSFGNMSDSVFSSMGDIGLNVRDTFTEMKDNASQKSDEIKQYVGQKWDDISQSTSQVWGTVKSDTMQIWNEINTELQPLLDSFKYLFDTVHQAIEILINRAMTAIKETIMEIWTSISEFLTPILQGIQNYIDTVWNSIKQSVTNTVNNIKEIIIPIWESIKEDISVIVNVLQTIIAQVWSKIKENISTSLSVIKTIISGAFNFIKSTFTSSMSTVYTIVKSGFDKVQTYVTGLAKKAYSWGKDFIMGMVRGIKSCMRDMTDAVNGIADKIRSVLHFSVPDEGPLTDYETWMPDFVHGMASGIEKSKYRLVDAVHGMAGEMQINMPAIAAPTLRNMGGAGMQVQTAPTGGGDNDKLYNLLSQLLTNMQSMGDITIPVYLGNDLIDEQVVKASDRRRVRSGGRA